MKAASTQKRRTITHPVPPIVSERGRWLVLIAGALLSTMLGGIATWVTAQSRFTEQFLVANAQREQIGTSQQAQISALRDEVKSLGHSAISQQQFDEYRRGAEAQRTEQHDFQVRVDQRLAELLDEHAVMPRAKRRNY